MNSPTDGDKYTDDNSSENTCKQDAIIKATPLTDAQHWRKVDDGELSSMAT